MINEKVQCAQQINMANDTRSRHNNSTSTINNNNLNFIAKALAGLTEASIGCWRAGWRFNRGLLVKFTLVLGLVILLRIATYHVLSTTNLRGQEVVGKYETLNRPLARIFVDVGNATQEEEVSDTTFPGKKQDDPSLVAYVRSHLLVPPSKKPYNLKNPGKLHYSQFGQSLFADSNFLHGMVGGFFIEAGALDGEYLSNSLYFEKHLNWRGLLVEPDPQQFSAILNHNRKAYCIKAGLSLTNFSGTVKFRPSRALGRIRPGYEKGVTINVVPLYTLLLALDVQTVDFFSLDIEGDELKVLYTIPWDKIKVRLMVIEINHVPGGAKAVIRFMELQGFTFLGIRDIDAWFGRRDLLQETIDVDEFLREFKVNKNRKKILTK